MQNLAELLRQLGALEPAAVLNRAANQAPDRRRSIPLASRPKQLLSVLRKQELEGPTVDGGRVIEVAQQAILEQLATC